MIIKTSFKSILRTKLKTALFLVLVALVSAMLGLGASLLSSGAALIKRCDESYATIALFEYMGQEYPKRDTRDPAAAAALESVDFGALAKEESALSLEMRRVMLGSAPGVKKRAADMPWRDIAVLDLTVSVLNISEGLHYAVVETAYYSYYDVSRTLVILSFADGFVPEKGQRYVVTGQFYNGRRAEKHFLVRGITDIEQSGEDLPAVLKVEKGEEVDLSAYRDAAETYGFYNSSLTVYVSPDPTKLYEFHQGTIALEKGRTFTEEEARTGAKVCVVSSHVASALGVSVGGTMDLALINTGDFPVYESFWGADNIRYQSYEIVGITTVTDENYAFLYIPYCENPGFFGYTLAQASLKNGAGDAFISAAKPLLPPLAVVGVYDGGYSLVAEPLKSFLSVSAVITLISVLAAGVVMFLFGYLFVARQRETVETMHALGTPKKGVFGYLLISSGSILFAGALLGSVGAALCAGRISGFVSDLLSAQGNADLHYSNANLGLFHPFDYGFAMPVWILTLCALFVLAAGLGVCSLFAAHITRPPEIKTVKTREKKKKAQKKGRSSLLPGKALRFALLSASRGGVRTLVVPCLAAALTFLVCGISQASARYGAELSDLGNSAEISGRFTDPTGKMAHGLSVNAAVLEKLNNYECFDTLDASKSYPYLYRGVARYADGREGVLETIEAPAANPYALETFKEMIERQPRLVYTSSMAATAEFYYAGGAKTDLMEDWDEGFLKAGDKNGYCMVSSVFMAEKGISPGDTIGVYESTGLWEKEYTVIGSFEKQASGNNIYCPLAGYFDLKYLDRDEYKPEVPPPFYVTGMTSAGPQEMLIKPVPQEYDMFLRDKYFDCITFGVKGLDRLKEVKQFLLENEYSEVGKLRGKRFFPIFNDSEPLNTERALSRHIKYMAILYPLMLGLVCGAGFVVSYLMTGGRKGELAVMRGLGAKKTRVFFSFFSEQAVLCLAGCLAGVLLRVAAGGFSAASAAGPAAVFAAVYLTGTAAAITVLNGSKLLSILSAGE